MTSPSPALTDPLERLQTLMEFVAKMNGTDPLSQFTGFAMGCVIAVKSPEWTASFVRYLEAHDMPVNDAGLAMMPNVVKFEEYAS